MLYQLYESQRALLAPFSEFASASSKLYDHPLSPFTHTPLAHRISAGFELLHRLSKEYEKPPFNINSVTVGGTEVAIQEQVAATKPFCRLLRFKRFTDNGPVLEQMKQQPTVLVVAPLSGHHATLLRDTVRSLLQDHKVYITDWTDARMVPADVGPFHLDDYVAYVQEFIELIGPEVNVISVCQPTVPVLAAVSLLMRWAADDQVLPPAGGYGPQAVPPSPDAAPLPAPPGRAPQKKERHREDSFRPRGDPVGSDGGHGGRSRQILEVAHARPSLVVGGRWPPPGS